MAAGRPGRRTKTPGVHPDTVRLAALKALLAYVLVGNCAPFAHDNRDAIVAAMTAGESAADIMRKYDLTCERMTGALVRLVRHGSWLPKSDSALRR